MSPLTPGCKALVINGSQSGTEVTAIKHVGVPALGGANTTHDCWEIDPPLPWSYAIDPSQTIMLDIFPTQYLMKIDGDYEHKEQDAAINRILEKST